VKLPRPAALVFAACAAAATAGCGKQADGASTGRPGGGPGSAGARPAQPVEVAEAQRRRVEDAITGTGQIEAVQSIELRPEVEGRIVEILFREGAPVEEGQPLFRIDDSELRTLVAQAEANRDLAQQSLDRTRLLMASQGATQSDLERAEAQARSSQAQLDLLRLRLNRTTVRAPFTGVAGARTVSLGDFVNSQTRLVTLQTVNPQRATLNLPERYAERLRVGQRITFTVAALGNREFTGIVDFVDPVVTQPARTILIKAQALNPRRELQPGMFVEGRLVAAVRENAVVVPEEAILPVQGAAIVYVVENETAQRREVRVGWRTPGFAEIVAGLEAGERVVVGGLERLTQGAPVRSILVTR
jgi:membrane fusion protein (multidrug efflux system)